jgi:hypothetical protein
MQKAKRNSSIGVRMNVKPKEWCCVPVIVDDAISELFQMPAPDEDPHQRPAFRVTQATVELVPQDFGRYKPSLERMAEDWRHEKELVMQQKKIETATEAA